MPTTLRIASVGGSQVVEINEDKSLEDVVREYEAQGLQLTSGGQPVTPETPLTTGDTLVAAPKDAKLG